MSGRQTGVSLPDFPCPWCGQNYPTRYTLRSMLAWLVWSHWHQTKHTIRKRRRLG